MGGDLLRKQNRNYKTDKSVERRTENLQKVQTAAKADADERFGTAKRFQRDAYRVLERTEQRRQSCVDFMESLRKE